MWAIVSADRRRSMGISEALTILSGTAQRRLSSFPYASHRLFAASGGDATPDER
jgi:hypothetical protein